MINTDVVIVGAGPCGLFQVFELGLLGLKAHIVDSIRQPGGQCTELYPDKPIYDIPGIPVCSGTELTEGLLKQIEPFDCGMHLNEEVTVVRKNNDNSFYVETNAGTQFHAKAIVIAGGVGSFQPRQIRFPGIDNFEAKNLHYRVQDPKQFTGKKAGHSWRWRFGTGLGTGTERHRGAHHAGTPTRRVSRCACFG